MPSSPSSLHSLLLLSDSALPLGSFAFSSGLESYLAHHKATTTTTTNHNHNNAPHQRTKFDSFLSQSLLNISSTALPHVLTAYNQPDQLENLDNEFDASTPCTVARRASIAQGKALLNVWERALSSSDDESDEAAGAAAAALTAFSASMKSSKPDVFGLQLNAHFPALFGAACRALGLSEEEASYLFLLSHAKTLLSAGVRASVLGPYQSQAVLASAKLQAWIRDCIENFARGEEGGLGVEVKDAAVTVPTMDLWMGRHELLYSRIFNS